MTYSVHLPVAELKSLELSVMVLLLPRFGAARLSTDGVEPVLLTSAMRS